jgi:hypothetical protein
MSMNRIKIYLKGSSVFQFECGCNLKIKVFRKLRKNRNERKIGVYGVKGEFTSYFFMIEVFKIQFIISPTPGAPSRIRDTCVNCYCCAKSRTYLNHFQLKHNIFFLLRRITYLSSNIFDILVDSSFSVLYGNSYRNNFPNRKRRRRR